MKQNPFNLGDTARLTVSGETGTVIGLAIYTNHDPQCLLRYKASDGRATDGWWDVDALEPLEAENV